MTAGRGVMHEEEPVEGETVPDDRAGRSEAPPGFLLWPS